MSNLAQESTTATADGGIQKPLQWFKHPANLRNDPRVGLMRAEFGARSYCWLIDTLEILAAAGGCLKLPNVDKYLAREFDEATDDEVDAWIDLCVELGLLSAHDGITSALLDDSFGSSQAASERGKRGAQAKLRDTLTSAQAQLKQCSSTTQAEPKRCVSGAQARTRASHSLSNSSSRSGIRKEEEGVQGEEPLPGIKITGFLHLDEIGVEALKVSHGVEVVDEAIRLSNAHIAKHAKLHDFETLKRQALEGVAFISGWPLKQARIDLDEREASSARAQRARTGPDVSAQHKATMARIREMEAADGK